MQNGRLFSQGQMCLRAGLTHQLLEHAAAFFQRKEKIIQRANGMAAEVEYPLLVNVALRNKASALGQNERKDRNRHTDDNAFSAVVFNDRLCSLHERSPDKPPAPKAGRNSKSVVGKAKGDEKEGGNSPIRCRWAKASISRTVP